MSYQKPKRKTVFLANDNSHYDSEGECSLKNAELELIGLIQSQMAKPGSVTSQFTNVNSSTAPTIAGKCLMGDPKRARDLLNRVIYLKSMINKKKTATDKTTIN
jgi:hypothetical protein